MFPSVPAALLRTVLLSAFHCPLQLNRVTQSKGRTPPTQQAAGPLLETWANKLFLPQLLSWGPLLESGCRYFQTHREVGGGARGLCCVRTCAPCQGRPAGGQWGVGGTAQARTAQRPITHQSSPDPVKLSPPCSRRDCTLMPR